MKALHKNMKQWLNKIIKVEFSNGALAPLLLLREEIQQQLIISLKSFWELNWLAIRSITPDNK